MNIRAGNKNIKYISGELVRFYSLARQTWNDLYPSERWVFDKVAGPGRSMGDVLDVGCACGGLGKALEEKFSLKSYTGIDINTDSIVWASKNVKLSAPSKFIAGDMLETGTGGAYDEVISLSCVDWNVETDRMVRACWEMVKPGGYFITSLRITDKDSVNDIKKSYQRIDFSGSDSGPEIANYVIFNIKDAVDMMKRLSPQPASIGAYGYWGVPSSTAAAPYERLVFAVFYVKKSGKCIAKRCATDLNMPPDILEKLK